MEAAKMNRAERRKKGADNVLFFRLINSASRQPPTNSMVRGCDIRRRAREVSGVMNSCRKIMIAVHKQCFEAAEEYGQPGNLVMGANIAGFIKVADAMLDQGLV